MDTKAMAEVIQRVNVEESLIYEEVLDRVWVFERDLKADKKVFLMELAATKALRFLPLSQIIRIIKHGEARSDALTLVQEWAKSGLLPVLSFGSRNIRFNSDVIDQVMIEGVRSIKLLPGNSSAPLRDSTHGRKQRRRAWEN